MKKTLAAAGIGAAAITALVGAGTASADNFTVCPSGMSGVSTDDTSCAFADNVRWAWYSQPGTIVTAYSPVTGLAYDDAMHLNGYHLLVRSKAVRGRERLRRRPDRLRRLGQSSGAVLTTRQPTTCPIATSRTSRPPRTTPEPRSAGCGHRAHARRNETFGASGPERKRKHMKKMITAALGGALLTSTLLGAACANAEMPPLPQAGEYSTCGEAAQDGVFNIPEGDENYWDEGDRDGDGIACEKN